MSERPNYALKLRKVIFHYLIPNFCPPVKPKAWANKTGINFMIFILIFVSIYYGLEPVYNSGYSKPYWKSHLTGYISMFLDFYPISPSL